VSTETDQIHIGHVGDSRCYRIRDGEIEQLTRDHSLINDALALKPDLTPEELARLPKNIITRALGMKDAVKVDIQSKRVQPGDMYLLCSDGLSGMVSEEQMLEVLEFTRDPQEACDLLVAMANDAGGTDNISAVIIRIDGDGEAAAPGGDETTRTYRIDHLGMLMPPDAEEPPSIRTAEIEAGAALSDADPAVSSPRPSKPASNAPSKKPRSEPVPSPAQQADRPPRSVGRYVTVTERGSNPPPRETPRQRKHVEVRVARCKRCNHELFIGNAFCVECGTPIKL
jgi:protein phosphatase